MLRYLIVMISVVSSVAVAAPQGECQELANKMGMKLDEAIVDLEGVFQGDEPEYTLNILKSEQLSDSLIETYEFKGFHNNEDGDSWVYSFRLEAQKTFGFCLIKTFGYLGAETLSSFE